MLTREIAKLYKEFTSVLKVTGGKLRKLDDDSYAVEASFKVTDCENRRKSTIKKLYNIQFNGKPPGSINCVSSPSGYQTNELAEATTNNGRYTARLVNAPKQDVDGENNQILEIWEVVANSGVNLLKSIDISKVKEHGRIVLEQSFFAFEWDCGNQNKLLYTCLTKPKKHSSPFEEPSENQSAQDVEREFDKKDDWGETLVGIDHTAVGVLWVEDNFSITLIDMPNYSLANSQWLQDGKIISEAYKEEPRLGLVYCNNRPSKICVHDPATGYYLPVVGRLESEDNSFNNLRVNNGRDKFLIAKNCTFGPHFQPSKLALYDANLELISELIDDNQPLFIDCLPKQCFSSDDKHILFAYSKNLRSELTLLNVVDLNQLQIKTPCETISEITFKDDMMLICGSSINQPPSLYLGRLGCPDWLPVVESPRVSDLIDYEVILDIQTSDKEDQISAIMLKPKSQESKLTVFVIHGGPCSSFNNTYYENFAFFIKSGFSVVLINYRGSRGVDEAHLRKLSGSCGITDVEDCSEVIRYFIRRELVDPKKLAVFGGSHGGFLVGHLCAKGEFQFLCAIMINPVLDLASSFFTADIPDWVMEMALGKNYDPKWMPQLADLERMFNQSPLFKAANSKVPTLMLLGSKDMRVKMYQGLRWIEHLKSQGVDTCCKVYPDTHQLLNHIPDYVVSATVWLIEYASRELHKSTAQSNPVGFLQLSD